MEGQAFQRKARSEKDREEEAIVRTVKVMFVLGWLLLLVPSALLYLDVAPRHLQTAGAQG